MRPDHTTRKVQRMDTTSYDAIIIGFGKGGKTLAGALASHGERVALIERDPHMYGGTCINVGCIPSKSLITQAEHRTWTDAVAEKRRVVEMLRGKNLAKLQNAGVDIITATAAFAGPHEVTITGELDANSQPLPERVLTASRIFINTGSTPVIPPIPGLSACTRALTSDAVMDLDELPERLAIIGGGYIGLEFASMFARYGSQVTVFERGNRVAGREDEDVSNQIREILEAQGVTFELESAVTAVRDTDGVNNAATVSFTDGDGTARELAADIILVATGRRANTEHLNLAAAGIDTDTRGTIIVDEHLRTSAEGVWALGDVKGGLQFTYISLDDYRIVANQLFGDGTRTTENRGNVAFSVFIAPTFSHVGMREREAKEAGRNVRVFRLPVAAVPKAHVLGKPMGLMKAVVDVDTDRILGASIISSASEELVNFVALAMDQDLPYQAVRDHIFTHPTMSEALNDLFA